MYWLNPDTSEIIAYEVNGLIEEKVDYSFKTRKAIENM
jgi:hypothetical protein